MLQRAPPAVLAIPIVLACGSACGGLTEASAQDAGGSPITDAGALDGRPPDSSLFVDAGSESSAPCSPMPGIVTIAPASTAPGGGFDSMTIDETSVYWASAFEDGGYAILKAPKCGGETTTLASGPWPTGAVPGPMAADGTSAYWVSVTPELRDGGGEVLSVPLGGGSVHTLATTDSTVWGLAIDATYAYWTTTGDGPIGGLSGNGTVMRAPLTGGTPVTMAGERCFPSVIVVGGANLYWSDCVGDGARKQIMTMPVSGGQLTVFSALDPLNYSLAINSTTLFSLTSPFVDSDATPGSGLEDIVRAPLDGGAPKSLASAPVTFGYDLDYFPFFSLLADDASLYYFFNGSNGGAFHDGGANALMKIPLTGGGSPVTLASGGQAANCGAVDATSLFCWQGLGSQVRLVSITPK